MTPETARRPSIPRGVWALGVVSMFMDVSSEMIHSLLPVFLVSVLGASVTTVGFLEGFAEATASITKVFSGTWSDRLGKRKMLTVVGYGIAALSKPLFALAPTTAWIFGARFADRVGKGIRGAPRDALITELTPGEVHGAAFGLRQTLDTIGAVAGPLLAVALMAATANQYRTVFWLAAIPAAVSVTMLVLFVREPKRVPAPNGKGPILWRQMFGTLGAPYWWVVVVATLFTLARFGEAFLLLKLADVGLGAALVPIVLVVMNVVYAASAYPAGYVSDQMGRWGVLAAGALTLVVADVALAFAGSPATALAGVALWGLHMGFTQGLFAALVADVARPEQRGTAFGVFNLVTGLALLAASVLAGELWDAGGARLAFLTGAGLTGLAALATLLLYARGRLPRRGRS
jgi:MFS family permease